MFGKIAKLFKKSAPRQSETPFAPESGSKSDTQALRRGQFGGPGVDASASQTRLFKRRKGDAAGEIDSISLPFTAILQLIPKELHGKMAAGVSNALSYNLPKAVALEQLSRGAVKVAFGDLRRAAPAGLFAGSGGHDSRLVDLPLREILNRLDPEAFARRSTHRVSIPEDVTDIFGAKGERLTDVRVVSKSELKTPGQKSAAQPATAPAEPPPAPIRFPSSATPQVEQSAAPLAPATPIPFTALKAPAAPAAAR
ncbi:MAG TPA: hypothetical protein VK615_10115, partial [Candidatus Binatia bacterium]|nr:hypothetical protein [Candidatus Binatia bacterium]